MIGKHRLPSGNAGRPNLSHFPRNVSYYDLALAVLPIPLIVGLLAGKLLSLSMQTGVSAGALVSAMVVGHLLFRDPPTRRRPTGRFDGPSA